MTANWPRLNAGVNAIWVTGNGLKSAATLQSCDDGIATGATMSAPLRARRMRSPKILVSRCLWRHHTVAELHSEADDVICLKYYKSFSAIGAYYADFGQVSDGEVIDILARFPLREAATISQCAWHLSFAGAGTAVAIARLTRKGAATRIKGALLLT